MAGAKVPLGKHLPSIHSTGLSPSTEVYSYSRSHTAMVWMYPPPTHVLKTQSQNITCLEEGAKWMVIHSCDRKTVTVRIWLRNLPMVPVCDTWSSAGDAISEVCGPCASWSLAGWSTGQIWVLEHSPTSCSFSLHFLCEDDNVISQLLLLSGFPCLLSMNSTPLEL